MSVEHAWLVFVIYMLFLFLILIVCRCINIACLLCKLNRSNSNRNRFERQFVEETIPNEYSIQFPSVNFESSVINSLPTSQFKKDEGKEEMPVNAECAICLGEFEEGEWLKLLPSCSHGFHVSCIDTWFRSHSNCPLCRSCVSHDLIADTEYSVSLYRLIEVETLSREDFSTDRAAYLQSIRSEIPQNLEITHEFCPH